MGNYAFIDSQNLYLGIKEQSWELDFARFRVYLDDKFNVSKAFLFIGYVPGNEGWAGDKWKALPLPGHAPRGC